MADQELYVCLQARKREGGDNIDFPGGRVMRSIACARLFAREAGVDDGFPACLFQPDRRTYLEPTKFMWQAVMYWTLRHNQPCLYLSSF